VHCGSEGPCTGLEVIRGGLRKLSYPPASTSAPPADIGARPVMLLQQLLDIYFFVSEYIALITVLKQEAQLPQRNSASAAHMEGG